MYIDPGCGNPKPATPDPRDRTPAPRSRSPAASKKRKSRVPERRSRSPELNMRPMLGRFKNRKNRKNFGVQKSVRQVRFRQGGHTFSGPGPNFRKISEKKRTRRIRTIGVTASSTNPGNRAHAFRNTVLEHLTLSNKHNGNKKLALFSF